MTTQYVSVSKKYRDKNFYEHAGANGSLITVAQGGGGGGSTEYAPLSHTHSIQQITSGLNTGYAYYDGASWTFKNETYSLSTHNHDATYSALGHNHDASYSAIGHNHDASYVKIGVTNTNSLDFSIAPDAYGFSCAVNAYAYGADSYGIVGLASKIPVEGCNFTDDPDASYVCLAMRRDSANMTPPQVGCGVKLDAYLPVLGWTDPKLSERLAGYISFKWVDTTQGAEACDLEFWLLSHGTMTKVKTLTHDGTFV